MRTLWKGVISFGLVTIPVKLYAATESKEIAFHYLHAACRSPIRYQKRCLTCEREVPMAEIVRGYEYEPGQFVLMQEADFAALPRAATHTVDIVDFIHLAEVDPIYYDKSYFLEPGEGGAKAYALLRRAMEETGRVAVARLVLRSRESLAAIRVYAGGILALETMYYPDEVRSAAALAPKALPEVRPAELEMARELVTRMSGQFVPERYRSEYRQALRELIEQRIAGQQVVRTPVAPLGGQVVDLMEALRQSVEQARAQQAH